MKKETDRVLMKALARHVYETIRKGQSDLIKEQAAKTAFQNAMAIRVSKMIKEMEEKRKPTALQDYFTMKETWGDVGKLVAKSIGNIAADSVGINPKRIGNVIRALRRKRPAQKVSVSKVPARKKPKLKVVVSNDPVKMSRQDFAKHLKSSSNDLRKIKDTDLT